MALRTLAITPRWYIPYDELTIRAVRSSGPGGQNVNKVASKVTVRYQLLQSSSLHASLSESDKSWLFSKLETKLTTDGELLISCDEYRDQPQNKEAALARLATLLRQALRRPKLRKATAPTRGSKLRRLDSKKKRGDLKKSRQRDSEH